MCQTLRRVLSCGRIKRHFDFIPLIERPQLSRKIKKAVIPAAGKGTRLLPITKVIPKEMLPLGRKPVLEFIVDELISIGITHFHFVVSPEKLSIPAYFDEFAGIEVSYSIQSQQNGLADAVLCAEDFVAGDSFIVALGDSIITPIRVPRPTSRVLECFESTGADGVIIVMKAPKEEISRYGIVHPVGRVDKWFPIDLLIEKPLPDQAPSNFAIAGRYAFNASIFDYIRKTQPGAGGEIQLTDSISLMIADGCEVWGVPLVGSEIRRDIGTFETYFDAFLAALSEEAM